MITPSGSTPTPPSGQRAGSAGKSSTATSAGADPSAAGRTQTLPGAGQPGGTAGKPAKEGGGSATAATAAATAAGAGAATTPAGAGGAATAAGTSTGSAPSATAAVRKPTGQPRPATTTRRVRLSVARVDPWSVMKVSFLLSFAAGVAMVVATILLWMVLSGLNVFSDIDRVIRDIQPTSAEPFSVLSYLGLPRVTALAMVIAVIDVVLMTAVATLAAYLYNICSSLVGGIQLTLTDD